MAPFLIFLATIFLTFPPSSLASNSYNFPASVISAAPALSPPSLSSSSPPPPLPPPLSSPPPPPAAASSDISPLFPTTPGGPQLSPTESSLPIIPSSPSPPKPDDDGGAMAAPGPGMAFAPSRLLPDSSCLRLVNGGGFLGSVVVAGLVAFGLMQLSD